MVPYITIIPLTSSKSSRVPLVFQDCQYQKKTYSAKLFTKIAEFYISTWFDLGRTYLIETPITEFKGDRMRLVNGTTTVALAHLNNESKVFLKNIATQPFLLWTPQRLDVRT